MSQLVPTRLRREPISADADVMLRRVRASRHRRRRCRAAGPCASPSPSASEVVAVWIVLYFCKP